ncbi:MAG TPA: hypothetical protein VIU29_06850 [Candidatus Deferrimicrobiaceae bacterium]
MKPVVAVVSALMMLGLAASAAHAETLSVRPSLEVSERYDSNVLNAPHGFESSDTVTRVTPSLKATVSVLSTKLSAAAGFDAEYFAEHTGLDRAGMTKNFLLSSDEPLRITPNFTLRPTARYVESRDAVRRNQFTQTGAPGLAPAESQVNTRIGTRNYSGALNGTLATSANLELGFGAGAVRNDYFDAPSAFIGSKNYSANASVGYRWTPNLNPGIYGTAGYDEFDNGNDVRNFAAGLSGNYRFSEVSSFDARVGATWIRSDTGNTRIVRPSGRLEYRQAWRELTAALRASIDYAAGAFGTETKREDVSLRLADRFSADWSGDTSAVWQANRSLREPFPEDLMSVQWSAGVHYSVTRYARINLTGEMFRQWNRGGIGTDLFRESAMIGVDIGSDILVF